MPRDFESELREQDAPEHEAPKPDSPPRSAEEPPSQASSGAPKRKGARRLILAALGLGLLAGGAWFGHDWWTVGRFQVSTDDAYVGVDFAVMSAKLAGYVESAPVVENTRVKAGDTLLVLEDGDFRNALTGAEAQLVAQQATLARFDRQIEAARAAVSQAEAKRASAAAVEAQAAEDLLRYERLADSDFASGQRLEAARAAKKTADADVAAAAAGVTSAKAQVAVIEAQRAEATAALTGLRAARDRAARDLASATIRAPFDGVIGNLAVAAGDYVTPGKRLLAVVPLHQVYVEANFKETQIEDLTPGTPVRLHVDAYPDRDFTGRVVSLAPASGAVFSLLPPENATGNFTKVVQRVPVRVSVPEEIAAQGWLRPGLSVTATADTRADAAR